VASKPNGVYADEQGYLRISMGKHRNRRVHVLVAEAMLGRKLHKWEQVHHKNGDKLDASFENLEVVDVRQHGAVSARQYWYLKKHVWSREEKEWREYFDEANTSVHNHAELKP
jgi:HNH endonuclease